VAPAGQPGNASQLSCNEGCMGRKSKLISGNRVGFGSNVAVGLASDRVLCVGRADHRHPAVHPVHGFRFRELVLRDGNRETHHGGSSRYLHLSIALPENRTFESRLNSIPSHRAGLASGYIELIDAVSCGNFSSSSFVLSLPKLIALSWHTVLHPLLSSCFRFEIRTVFLTTVCADPFHHGAERLRRGRADHFSCVGDDYHGLRIDKKRYRARNIEGNDDRIFNRRSSSQVSVKPALCASCWL